MIQSPRLKVGLKHLPWKTDQHPSTSFQFDATESLLRASTFTVDRFVADGCVLCSALTWLVRKSNVSCLTATSVLRPITRVDVWRIEASVSDLQVDS